MVMVGPMIIAMTTCAECARRVTLGGQGSKVQQQPTLSVREHAELQMPGIQG